MTPKTCTVTVIDGRGIRHSVEVVAETLFAAAVLGIQVLKADGWTDPVGPATRVDVEVREPVTRHSLTLMQVQRYLSGASTSRTNRCGRTACARGLVMVRPLHRRKDDHSL
jgi:hypothetical protein